MITRLPLPYQPDVSQVFEVLRHKDWPIWLDSGYVEGAVEGAQFPGHYTDVLACNPVTMSRYPNTSNAPFGDTLEHLDQFSEQHPHDEQYGPGWLGYISYDAMDEFEPVNKRPKTDLMPLLAMGFYPWVIVVDHKSECCDIVALTEYKPQADSIQQEIIEALHASDAPKAAHTGDFALTTGFVSDTSREAYNQQFNQIKAYIKSGDCYQVNLTQHFSAQYHGDAYQAYLMLREANPSPMSCYFKCDDHEILSVSPERFIQKANNTLTSYPIKGTRPRHDDPIQDQALRQALQDSAKDRAENVMIVDLLRNDFGRICRTGSVTVPSLFAVESFPNVHHLVSTIEGDVSNHKGYFGLTPLLKAAFPGGSITGAPKVRAMQIIEELEPHRRSIYCGHILYCSGSRHIDSNITIRTFLAKDDRLHCWGGGGIVADSDCDAEYQEAHDKVGNLMQLLQTAT